MLAAAHMAAEAAGAAVTRGPGGGAAIEVDGAATEGARAAFEKAAALDASGNALGLNDAAQGAAAEWVDFAFSQWVTGDAAALFQAKKETLGSLQSIGVRSSDLQIRVLDACMDAGLRAALQRLESALLRTRFLSGGATLGAADFAVAAALADYFGTLLDDSARVAFPAVTRWFVAVSETRAFRAALPAFRIHLRRREGGQIDLRPDPVRAAALADGSIAKNASAKKQASQRQREKAAREEAAQPAQPAKAAGAAAAAAAGDEPEVKSAIAVTARVSRPTHEAFATPVGTADSEEAEEVAIAELERRLAALGISFTTVRHEKVMTVEEQAQHVSALGLEGALTKNLFLKVRMHGGGKTLLPPLTPRACVLRRRGRSRARLATPASGCWCARTTASWT